MIKKHSETMIAEMTSNTNLGVKMSNVLSLLSGQTLALLVALPWMLEMVTL